MTTPKVVKKTLKAGRGKMPDYEDGTKVIFDYEALKPIGWTSGNPLPESRDDYTSVDDTRKKWPHGYGQPLEVVFGKKFQLPVLETCVRSMLVNELAQFDIEMSELFPYPMVSKKLRDIGKGDDAGHSHMCGATLTAGTGYNELDILLKEPTPMRFIIHLLQVIPPGQYDAESWQLTPEEKLQSVTVLKDAGGVFFKEGKNEQAIEKYKEALGRLETLILREKPGDTEWDELDKKNIPLYLNLSQCYINIGNFYEATETANEALKRDPKNTKALYRRAKARIQTWNLDEAEEDLNTLLSLDVSCEGIVRNEKQKILEKRKEKDAGERIRSKNMLKAFR